LSASAERGRKERIQFRGQIGVLHEEEEGRRGRAATPSFRKKGEGRRCPRTFLGRRKREKKNGERLFFNLSLWCSIADKRRGVRLRPLLTSRSHKKEKGARGPLFLLRCFYCRKERGSDSSFLACLIISEEKKKKSFDPVLNTETVRPGKEEGKKRVACRNSLLVLLPI